MDAWIYLRKSRAEAHEPDLLAAHRRTLLRLAEQDGVEIPPDHIIEEVGSADTLKDRPKFKHLLNHFLSLPKGAGGVLYAVDIDRLTRGVLADRGAVQQALLHAAIRIRTPAGTYDLSRPDDELMYEVRGLLGRQELAAYRRRVVAKWDDMTRRGEVLTGAAPYGYRWDRNDRTFVPMPEEFAIVKELFRLAPTVSTRRLGPMFNLPPDRVLNILRNPVYTAYPARHCESHRWPGGKGAKGTRLLKLDRFVWPEQPGRYPAAVSRADWEAVQVALTERKRTAAKTGTTPGWCRDVLQFEGRAETPIQLGSHHAAAGMVLTYSTVPGWGKRLYVAREIVHSATLEALLRLAEAPQTVAQAIQAYRASQREEGPPAAPQRTSEAIRRDLGAAREQLARLKEQGAADAEDRLALAAAERAVKAKIERLKAELDRVARQPTNNNQPAELDALPELLAGLPALWPTLAEHERREVVDGVLSAVVARITPRPHPVPYLREVVEIRYQPWLVGFTD